MEKLCKDLGKIWQDLFLKDLTVHKDLAKILAVTYWQDLARFAIEISWKELLKILQRSWQDLVRFVHMKYLGKILTRSW